MYRKATEENNCNNCRNMARDCCDFWWIDGDEICDSYKKKEHPFDEDGGASGDRIRRSNGVASIGSNE